MTPLKDQQLPLLGETSGKPSAECRCSRYGGSSKNLNDRMCFLNLQPGLFGSFDGSERVFNLSVHFQSKLLK
jgi:hypothetical protein